ncbi:MAG: hypothetical protein ABI306_07165 [Caulobacteraceae bacterium]
MPDTIGLRQLYRSAIDADIAARLAVHQSQIARLTVGAATLAAVDAPAARPPLVLLAHGDSWFDYPLDGNTPSLGHSDVIAHLGGMGAVHPLIANVSHWGDASTSEMSLPKQERMIQALNDPANWLAGRKPDAILFSGGGDDIAGDQFCIFLDYANPAPARLDQARFEKALGVVEASYLDLFAFRDRYAPNVPIFGHAYDFAIPNGTHPPCIGPWLKPSLDYCGCTDPVLGAQIVSQALTGFRDLLRRLAASPANNFILVDTQGTLKAADWANELHPYPPGFQAIAAKFVAALAVRFPGRI